MTIFGAKGKNKNLHEDLDKRYNELIKELDKLIDRVYNREANESPVGILIDNGYEQYGDHIFFKIIKENGVEYKQIFDFTDYNEEYGDAPVDYYVLKNGVMPKGYTISRAYIDDDLDESLEEGVWDDIKKVGKAVGQGAKQVGKTLGKEVKDAGKKWLDKEDGSLVGDAVRGAVKGVKNAVDKTKDAVNAVKDSDTVKNIKNAAGTVKDAVKSTDTYKNKSNKFDNERGREDLTVKLNGGKYKLSDLHIVTKDGKKLSPQKIKEFAKLGNKDRKAMIKKYNLSFTPHKNAKPIKEDLREDIDLDLLREDYDDDYGFDTNVLEGNNFIEDGKEWEWTNPVGDEVHLDFDNWQVWEAVTPEIEDDWTSSMITGYFVVDIDTGFIDWGPCDTEKEAEEFLQSKVNDYNDEDDDWYGDSLYMDYDESYNENKVVEESFKVGDRVKDKWANPYRIGTVKNINGEYVEVEWDYSDGEGMSIVSNDEIDYFNESLNKLSESFNREKNNNEEIVNNNALYDDDDVDDLMGLMG